MDSLVEFGVLVKGCRVVSRQMFIHNDGSVDGEFSFSYAGNLPLTLWPSHGQVPPKSSKIVKVDTEIVSVVVNSLLSHCWVGTEKDIKRSAY